MTLTNPTLLNLGGISIGTGTWAEQVFTVVVPVGGGTVTKTVRLNGVLALTSSLTPISVSATVYNSTTSGDHGPSTVSPVALP